ncbi:MAG TPA: DHA2 family efflux MFS transporter permease subunit [Actinomycetales bacterium]|nr:DHA2 family efflux MFS transporter permease subunit [Actinomycetales bacterium]
MGLIGYGEPAGRWVLAATVLGSSVGFLDATVVNIALPSIGRDLGASATGLTWTVNAYALTLAAFVLTAGTAGDRFGRRRVYMVGLAWFGVTSLLCALATSTGMLVVLRALQGVGAALVTPGALAIIQSSFRPDDRPRAVGAWSGLAGIAGAVGPFLGGWLVDVGSWRWIFLLNVPVVAAVLLITARHVPESRDVGAAGRFDLVGAGLAAVALGGLTYGLSSWAAHGAGSISVQAGLSAGVLALIAFVLFEGRTSEPMLPLDVFSSALFSMTNVVTLLVYAALGGVLFWLVIALQVVSGWDPLPAGLSLLPVTVLMLLFSARSGALGARIGPRIPMTVGPLVAAVGVALLSRVGADAAYLSDVLLPVTLLGVGLTLTVAPLTATVLSAVPESRAGLASGVNNAVARTGGLLLVAVLPALTGIGVTGFREPGQLAPAFRTAMLVCAALLAVAAVVAAVGIRALPLRPEATAVSQQRRCPVDGPPIAVSE